MDSIFISPLNLFGLTINIIRTQLDLVRDNTTFLRSNFISSNTPINAYSVLDNEINNTQNALASIYNLIRVLPVEVLNEPIELTDELINQILTDDNIQPITLTLEEASGLEITPEELIKTALLLYNTTLETFLQAQSDTLSNANESLSEALSEGADIESIAKIINSQLQAVNDALEDVENDIGSIASEANNDFTTLLNDIILMLLSLVIDILNTVMSLLDSITIPMDEVSESVAEVNESTQQQLSDLTAQLMATTENPPEPPVSVSIGEPMAPQVPNPSVNDIEVTVDQLRQRLNLV